MDQQVKFLALSPESLPARLGTLPALVGTLGSNPAKWRVREVGDGNLNLVFIVESDVGSVVVKQALPYVRLVGESWPLPLKRSFFEFHALTRLGASDPGRLPAIHYFDEAQAIIVMDFLSPHIILRRALIEGRALPDIGRVLGEYLARAAFRNSDLCMKTADKKAAMALFAGNVELCDITENLVFSDPYFAAAMNRHTTPQLDALVTSLRADRDLKVAAQQMKHTFSAQAETLCHGDMHTGSVMVTEVDVKVIDPEFAFYGPFGFDIGMLLANYWMNFFSQRGHEGNGGREALRAELLDVVILTWDSFSAIFAQLWQTERNGILYQRSLFEDQGDHLGSEQALQHVLHGIWIDMLGFAGIEIHRRILGLAHNADFESIQDVDLRAACEARALKFGRHLAVNRASITYLHDLNALAMKLDQDVVK
jgi:5-methylthioribose kinase